MSQIYENEYRSNVLDAVLGVPQGGPRSGDMFCFFTSDLPEELKANGVGITILTIFLTCLVFLDDWCLPLKSEAGVIRALQVLYDYAERWSLTWALNKLKVLTYNVRNAPKSYPFGPDRAPLVKYETYLAVIFSSNKLWNRHFKSRLRIAQISAAKLRKNGLLGGRNNPARSVQMVRAVLYATIDYGRGATSTMGRGHTSIIKFLFNFQF